MTYQVINIHLGDMFMLADHNEWIQVLFFKLSGGIYENWLSDQIN